MTTAPDTNVVQFQPAQIGRLTMLANTNQKIAELQEVADQLKADIIADLGVHEAAVDDTGRTLVTYKQTRKFDINAAAQQLNARDLAACTVSSLDAKLVKAKLTGEQLQACMIPSTTRTFSIK